MGPDRLDQQIDDPQQLGGHRAFLQPAILPSPTQQPVQAEAEEGDLAAQSEQAYLNVATALRGLGASTDDVTHVTVYVVGYTPAAGKQVMEGRRRAADRLGVDFQHPGTFVGVTSLFHPDYLIEVQATAVLD